MLDSTTTCIFYGNHTAVLQRMLDYDYLCGRSPSVVAIMVPDLHTRPVKVFFGDKEIFIPQINRREDCKPFAASVLINFASQRSAPQVIRQALEAKLFDYIFTVAEGIPERETRELIALAKWSSTKLIGPSVVGGIVAGALRVWNTWWSRENIMISRLWRPGSIGLVSKSGGMMNELCRVVSHYSDGVHTAMQVGGDRFPMTRFVDIVLDYEQHPDIKLIVLLGEVGNQDENEIAELIEQKKIQKPVVARVAGSAAEALKTEVQFGHAGAKANAETETASFKNDRLRTAGAFVPENYEEFGALIGKIFQWVMSDHGQVTDDVTQIQEKLQVIKQRRATRFTSTISDERGEEVLYDGIPIQEFVQQGSLGKVIWHLRLKKELPDYACRFLDTVLILLADHGPAVSGATNTIITARAGKDLISSLIAGLATIWPRFGGAIDGAARRLFDTHRQDKTAQQVVEEHKARGEYIQGIGHKIKSIHNPDKRCVILYELGKQFPVQTYLDLAKQVEQLTTQKKPNLILNVDGHVAAILLDMMTDIWLTEQEIQQSIDAGLFNGFFVLARTVGFIGHYLDQRRLDEGLYRTPWEDMLYWG